jgi:sugar lactone lactonase YvrE
MRNLLVAAGFALAASLVSIVATGHPASGIVVDSQGHVLFIHTGVGVARIESDGTLTYLHPTRGGHWMCLDAEGSFSSTQPRFFERITPDGKKPAIIFADGGAPIAVCRDGNLYYGSGASETDAVSPGGLAVTRMSPRGELTNFAPRLKNKLKELNEGVTGIAAGPDGSLYVACWSAVLKVGMDGAVTTVAQPAIVQDCDADPPDHDTSNHRPCLRGLVVDSDGTCYAAATSCRRVLKITPKGKVSVILKAERPWSPTGVALRVGNLFVLEYTNANGGSDEGWLPRVRKLSADGTVSTLVTVRNAKEHPSAK